MNDSKVKTVKNERVLKSKAAKAHPSSTAGPGFSIRLSGSSPPRHEVFGVHPKGQAYCVELRDGDVLATINGRPVETWNLNEVKSKLVGPCGTQIPISILRVHDGHFAESGKAGGQAKGNVQTLDCQLILDFTPLVKALAGGKAEARGYFFVCNSVALSMLLDALAFSVIPCALNSPRSIDVPIHSPAQNIKRARARTHTQARAHTRTHLPVT